MVLSNNDLNHDLENGLVAAGFSLRTRIYIAT